MWFLKKTNLFWPVYKNLEKEFLELADFIHITEEQLNVYSMHIADLIVRCSIEIEAISKELYEQLGGNMTPVDKNGDKRDLYFDTDCLYLLEQKWKISDKQIFISTTNCFFNDDIILTPLRKSFKRGTSGSKWKQAYQAVKHERTKSSKKATIENLINSMGALFILNLYYKDDSTKSNDFNVRNKEFDVRAGSDVFSVFCYNASSISMTTHFNDNCICNFTNNDLDRCIYITKHTDESIRTMHNNFCKDHIITMKNFCESIEIQNYITKHPKCLQDKTVNQICAEAGGISLVNRIMSHKHIVQQTNMESETILNKQTNIYPELEFVEE